MKLRNSQENELGISLPRNALLLCGAIYATTTLAQPAWAGDGGSESPAIATQGPTSSTDPTPAGTQSTAAQPVSAAEQIVVLGQRATRVNAIEAQEYAPNLVNIVTTDEIRKLPDVNVAEAVSRVPGVSLEEDTGEGRFINIRGFTSDLNSTTFSGLRLPPSNPASPQNGGRAVALDAIPNGLVGSITVTKSNLPEQDAEALGGTIEITPKTAPSHSAPFVDFHIGAGYESLRGTPITDVSISAGRRFGGATNSNHSQGTIESYGDHPFSVVFTAAYYHDKRGIDDVEPAYLDDGVHPANTLSQIDMRRYQYDRQRHGVGIDLGYEPDATSKYYFRAFDAGYTEAKRDDHLSIGMAGNPVAITGGFTDGVSSFNQSLADEKEKIDNQVFMVGGQNKFGATVLDYRLGYTLGSYHQLYQYNPDFSYTPGAGTISYANTGAGSTPAFNVSGANYLNPTNYTLSSMGNQTTNLTDHEWSFASNLKFPVTWGGFDQESLKSGVDVRQRIRNYAVQRYSDSGLPATPLSSIATGSNGTYYNNSYPTLPFIPSGGAVARLYPNDLTISPNNQVNAMLSSAHDTENVTSAYGQYQMTSGKLSVVAGARIENTNAKYEGYSQGADASGNSIVLPTNTSHNYTNFFPGAQARYEIDDDTLLRGSFSTTIARPGFNQINPSAQVDPAANTVVVGNPNLKPTTANSFDLSLEKYLAHGGIASVGIFDKQISNYISASTYHTTFPNSGIYAGLIGVAQVTSYVNTPSGFARGLELNYQQRFTELPGMWSGLGVNGNLTLVDSRATIRPGYESTLPSTSRQTANAAVFYERDGLNLRLGVMYVSANLWSLGNGTTVPDTYSDSRLTVDFGSSYDLTNKTSFYLAAKNLTNAPLKFYEGTPNRPIQREFYGPTILAGLNYRY